MIIISHLKYNQNIWPNSAALKKTRQQSWSNQLKILKIKWRGKKREGSYITSKHYITSLQIVLPYSEAIF